MTKAQERKALEEIKAILEKAGADSYIGMAFHGCVELAQSNIDNDFANDPMEAIESARSNYESAKREAEDWKDAYNTLKDRYDTMKKADDKAFADMLKQRDEAVYKVVEANTNVSNLKAQLEDKDNEIIKLKAKLYDLMTA